MPQYRNVTPNAVSTNMNQAYLRSNFIPYGNVTVKGKSVSIPDIFNPRYKQVYDQITPTGMVSYQGEPIPTLSQDQYNNTSAWWLIGIANGVIHPLNIDQGTLLFIPDEASAITKTPPSNGTPPPSTVQF